jgi:hypothetical protein
MAIKIQGDIVIDDNENLIISGYGNFNGTSFVKLPAGTTAQRPTGGLLLVGNTRYNSTIGQYEAYTGSEWGDISVRIMEGVVHTNRQTVSANYTLPNSGGLMSVGPITINAGVSVTVPAGQRWLVI